ncbi:MAG: LapA family protein [Alphaproteobacteria bacterium]|nr:LapA family protein [Alphaproteobacteria bacterium]
MRFLFWLVILPLAVAMAFFAVNNRERVPVSFDPLPYEVQPPLFVLIIGAVFLGLFLGGIATWFGQHRWRAQTRALHRRVKHLEGEIEGFQARTAPPTAATQPQQRAIAGPMSGSGAGR